jgi:hypothetical protein
VLIFFKAIFLKKSTFSNNACVRREVVGPRENTQKELQETFVR